MQTINRRLANLEAQRGTKQRRYIILDDGEYFEQGKPLTPAEYQAIAEDPDNVVTVFEIVRESNDGLPGTV